jgi:dTMP kinase
MAVRGRCIVLEGIDGSGKTDLAERLGPPLVRLGRAVSRFREPTDAFLRARAAELLHRDPFSAAMCFTLDRAMLRPEVERSLAQGDLVVQDRSFFSTLAYQSPGLDGQTWKELERIQRSVAIEPDLVLYLDVPVDLAMKRIGGRGTRDAFEERGYLEEVRERFEQLFSPPRWIRLDASGTREATLEQALKAISAAGL